MHRADPAETTICMGIGLEEGLQYFFYFFWLLMTHVIGMKCRCRMWCTRSKQTYIHVCSVICSLKPARFPRNLLKIKPPLEKRGICSVGQGVPTDQSLVQNFTPSFTSRMLCAVYKS